jgi:AcrR family transcriptional regulator
MSRAPLKAHAARAPLAGHGPRASLYPQLRPRPHGPARDTIVRNQQARLCGATIEAITANGYDATSVAELSRLAGVSKRTFYEQYANKEACLLATHDRIVRRAIARVVCARRDEPDWEAGMRRAFEAFVRAAADHPKAARLVLVDALLAGPAALAQTDRARRGFERMVVSGFAQAPDGVGLGLTVARGIVYGVEHVVRQSVLDGGTQELHELAGGLAEWALAHGSAAIAELPPPAPAPRDRAERRPRVRARTDDARGRILRAAAELAASAGHTHVGPLAIADRAGVSERAFRACYEDAEECCLDALDLVGLEALTSAAAASRTAGDGPRGAYRGIAALLDHIAEDPLLRGAILVEAHPEDAAALERGERMLQRYVDLLASRLPRSPRPPGVIAEATVGALWGLVRHYVTAGAAHLLPELAGHAAYVALAPAVGAEAAVLAIAEEERACRSGEEVGGAVA